MDDRKLRKIMQRSAELVRCLKTTEPIEEAALASAADVPALIAELIAYRKLMSRPRPVPCDAPHWPDGPPNR